MTDERIIQLIRAGEGDEIEFKRAGRKIPRDVFETVCAFLNRNGGNLLLGVEDDGEVMGVDDPDKLIREFNTLANNAQKLNPPFYFLPEVVNVGEKKIIHIYIPASSQVHRTVNRIFDRSGEADIDITDDTERVSSLYLRKQTGYSENTIYPFAGIDDLRPDLLEKVRAMAKTEAGGDHPWVSMSDEELLRSAGLYMRDLQSGSEGLTLAAILLFGKDETILSALPHHRTDALLRVVDTDRYDDRDDVRTNLLESYERLMDFIKKHLPDPFFLEGDKRISLQNKIFREAIVNTLIHREYINRFPARMIIEKEKVVFENASRPHGMGIITPENFFPFPKNPKIAGVFRQIGLADELGSGVRNLFRYSKEYSGTDPEIIEGDIFRIIIHTPQATPQATPQVTPQDKPLSARELQIIEFCRTPRSREEIQEYIGIKDREYFRKTLLIPLIEKGLLMQTIPDKPQSPKQKYYSGAKK